VYLRAARRPKQFRCALAIAGAADGTQHADAQEPRGAGAVDSRDEWDDG
jgi:hypothetical protein